jgi:hypothetical protein
VTGTAAPTLIVPLELLPPVLPPPPPDEDDEDPELPTA